MSRDEESNVCCFVQVLDLIQSTVGDQRVKIELINGFDPLPVSSADERSLGFQIIKKTVLDMFPTVTVAPGKFQIDYRTVYIYVFDKVT